MTTTSRTTSAVEPAAPSGVVAGLEPEPARGEGGEKWAPISRRWWRSREGPSPWRDSVLAGLRLPGCLMCRQAEANLRRYYFWFLAEQYAHAWTVERLQRARGFCLRHTRHLLDCRAPSRTSVVAGYVLRSCAEWLRTLGEPAPSGRRGRQGVGRPSPGLLHPPVGCPACEDERHQCRRHIWALNDCLVEADVREAFRESAGLCLPHFLAAAPLAGWEALQCLVAEQIRHLDQARVSLAGIRASGSDGVCAGSLRETVARLYGPDLDATIRASFVAGRRPSEHSAERGGNGMSVRPAGLAGWSPAFEETCGLLGQPGCGICQEAAQGREEYLAWLEEEIRDFMAIGHRWSQVQYLCTEHAWLFADRCAPEMLATACDHLLAGIAEALRRLLWEIREPIPRNLAGRLRALPVRWRARREPEAPKQGRPPLPRRIRGTLGALWVTPRKFLDHALEVGLRWEACPLCRHLQTVEARALDRLIAVLADAEGLRAFQKSYGLCLRHAPSLLERAANPDLRRDIAQVLLARVEVDYWEVDEYLRKTSWSQRHEPKGPEEAAWLRATTRIAGVAMEREYGF